MRREIAIDGSLDGKTWVRIYRGSQVFVNISAPTMPFHLLRMYVVKVKTKANSSEKKIVHIR